jgi:hypothetical protein
MKYLPPLLVCMLALLAGTGANAQQSLQLEGTSITGNKELPKVLYIVPWKSVERFDMQAPKITSIMEQKLEPIDRTAFKRTINYHQAIYSKAQPAAPAID